MSLWNKLWKSIWNVLQCSFEWELHELIVKVLHWFGLVESLRGSFCMSHLHETAQGAPQHHTVSSETNAFQSADQETRPAATILAWRDHLQCGIARNGEGHNCLTAGIEAHARTDGWTHEIYRILQWRSTQDSIYGRRCIRYK